MRKLWKPGDVFAGPCETCGVDRPIRFERRTVLLDGPGSVAVPNVLLGYCSVCDSEAIVPPQSAARFRKSRSEKDQVAARIPALLEDAVFLVADQYDANPSGFASVVVRHYLRRIARDSAVADRVRRCLGLPIGSTDAAESPIKILAPRASLLDAAKRVGIEGAGRQSRVIRGILVLAAIDAEILVEESIPAGAGAGFAFDALASAC